MKLTPAQVRAIEAINRWLADPRPAPFILAGYAGTGKTTLLQEFINSQDKPVRCCAPTGKAASVLQKRLTNAKVSTVHKALYKPVNPSLNELDRLLGLLVNSPEDRFLQQAVAQEKARLADLGVGFALRDDCDILPGTLCVIDEASMVTTRMYEDLLRTNAKILFVGDPGQLPPVRDAGFFRSHPPDVMLDEVLRQALDSPIITLSMMIRDGWFPNGDMADINTDSNSSVKRMPKAALPPKEWLKYDQVITGKNETRRKVNRYFRGQLYPHKYGPDGSALGVQSWWPVAGDKLICLKNECVDGTYFVNGVCATAASDSVFNGDLDALVGEIEYEGAVVSCPLYRYPFQVHYDAGAPELAYYDLNGVRQMDYAYAITVHKSQGSEWDNVIFADDGMSEGRAERKLLLYTAVTRAKKSLVWLY